jgi:RecJ-like exonuclease
MQVNPHTHGIDGSRAISGAGVAYLTAKSMDASNVDLAALAVVGALGDMQDKNQRRELNQINYSIVKDAVDSGYMQAETDLILYGRETRPLHKALSYTTNPYIQGLSGEEDKCLGFLVNLGIDLKIKDHWRTINDLSVDEKQKIFSEIAKFLSSKKFSSSVALSLIGMVYTLVKEDRWTPLRDAREYSSLLNACGRMSKSGLGVSIGIGSRGNVLDEAQDILTKYRRKLSECMNWLTTTPRATEELMNIYVIRGTGVIDDLMLSTIASILTTSDFFSKSKPIIALTSTENGMIKVSGRIPTSIVDRGLNLGTILHDASIKFNGVGGGHDVAAGAQLLQGFEDDFIKTVDQLVGSFTK